MTTCPITDAEIEQELARVQSLRAMLVLHHPFFATLMPQSFQPHDSKTRERSIQFIFC